MQELFFSQKVEAVFRLNDTADCMAAGPVEGTVHVGDQVDVWLPQGVDRADGGTAGEPVASAKVLGIETGPGRKVQQATNQTAALILEGAKGCVAEGGFVSSACSAPSEDALSASDITALVDAWLDFSKFHAQVAVTREQMDERLESSWRRSILGELNRKILNADQLFCVVSKKTGCPALFSQILRLENGMYECVRPSIRIYPEDLKEYVESSLDNDTFELRCIQRGPAGTGVYNFLGSTFWQDGACAVEVVVSDLVIAAEDLVPPPDAQGEEGDAAKVVPVANPQLVRWLLLMGQMGRPETEDEKTAYQLYWNLFSRELPKARLLQPIQSDSSVDEDGSGQMDQGAKLSFPVMGGKNGQDAVYLYTDWKRLRTKWGAEWQGLVRTVDDAAQLFDCAINATDHPDEGCYVSQQDFQMMS